MYFAATAFGKIAPSQQWSSWLNAEHVLTHEDLLEHKELREVALQFTSVLKDLASLGVYLRLEISTGTWEFLFS